MSSHKNVTTKIQKSMPARLTPEQFKALARFKGWKYTELAERWGVTPVWVSAIARDVGRPRHYDDALHGLPNRHRLKAEEARRAKSIEDAIARVAGLTGVSVNSSSGTRKVGPGYRYHGYLTTGIIVTAALDVGSIAEEGERGMVFQVRSDNNSEVYGVIFETGMWDWFPPDYVDACLVSSGILQERMAAYQYVDEVRLQDDFDKKLFEFNYLPPVAS